MWLVLSPKNVKTLKKVGVWSSPWVSWGVVWSYGVKISSLNSWLGWGTSLGKMFSLRWLSHIIMNKIIWIILKYYKILDEWRNLPYNFSRRSWETFFQQDSLFLLWRWVCERRWEEWGEMERPIFLLLSLLKSIRKRKESLVHGDLLVYAWIFGG